MATGAVKIQVQSQSKSLAVTQQQHEVSSRPSSFVRSWVGPDSKDVSATSLGNVVMSPEVARVQNGDRARSSYTNALSLAKPGYIDGNSGSSRGAEQSPMVKRRTLLAPTVTAVSPSLPLGMPMSPKRKCLIAASINLTHGAQTEERFCFLCSDVFFIAKQKSRSGLRLKQQIPLSEMWISASVEGVTPVAVDSSLSFVIGWPMTNLVASFNSAKHRQMWFSKLERQIDTERANLVTQSTVVHVHVADKKLFPQSVDISVSTTDDVTSLVTRCCSKWSLETADVKLWLVTAGRSVPLIGHESPLAIKLSMQKTHSGKSDGSNQSGDVQQDDSSNCRFILRSVRKTDSVEPSALQKLLKRPLLSIKLKRDNKKTLSIRGLFGRPLVDVCPENRLPESLMAMLEKIFSDGVYTVGVLRKAANKRRINEVRDKLDAGDDVTIESAILAAGLFKEYLRSLPECLLTRGLYDNWLESMTIEDTAARLARIKELCAALPACNRLLLSYIFCILYHMNQNSDINKMTSYNLAVCISSTLLWTESISAEDSIRSASLVAFLIEHTTDIFGDDCVKLLGDLPPLDADKIAADEPSTPDTGNDKMSSVFSSADSLDSPVTDYTPSTYSPRLTDSGCYTSSMDGDSLSPLSMSLADVTSRVGALTPLRSRSLDDELDDASNSGLRLDSLIEMIALSPLDQDEETDGVMANVDDFMLALQEETMLSNAITLVNDTTVEAALSADVPQQSLPAIAVDYDAADSDNDDAGNSTFECLSRDAVNRRPLSTRRHHSQISAPHIDDACENDINNARRHSSFSELTLSNDGASETASCCSIKRMDSIPTSSAAVRDEVDYSNSAANDVMMAQLSAVQHQPMLPLYTGPALADDEYYHFHGVLSVKGPSPDLHLASVKKVNSMLVHSSPNTDSTTPVTRHRREGTVGSVHHSRSHANEHLHQSRQLPVPPPYQEAVWRAQKIRQGVDPEGQLLERGPAASRHGYNNSYTNNQHRAFKDYSPSTAHQQPVIVKAGHHLHKPTDTSQQYARTEELYDRSTSSPLEPQPTKSSKTNHRHRSHKQRHSHHAPSQHTYSDAGRRSRTPQPERPSGHHQRRCAATPTYPEGFWVTRLEHHTTDEDDSSSTGGHSGEPLSSSYGGRSNAIIYDDAGYAPEYSHNQQHVSGMYYSQYNGSMNSVDQSKKSFHYPHLASQL